MPQDTICMRLSKGGACNIPAGKTVKVHTGIAVEIPDGCFGAIFARSGIATKRGLRPANCVGVVDSDYRGKLSLLCIMIMMYVRQFTMEIGSHRWLSYHM